jgi:flagellum-specific ATP synthase
MDSVTRYAMAQREIGLAIGEPPATRGYPPSVFSLLPTLLERAGTNQNGSITGFFTVLVEGDDLNDPVGDTTRSILDGHIVLSRDLASAAHYPSIDVLQSVSRVMSGVATPDHLKLAQELRRLMAAYRRAEDMVNIGAYKPGSNPEIDQAIEKRNAINRLLSQGVFEKCEWKETFRQMKQVFGR